MAKATAKTSSRGESTYQPTLNLPAPNVTSRGVGAYEAPVQLRLSQHTRQLGLKHIALITAQIAEQQRQIAEQQQRIEAERANAA